MKFKRIGRILVCMLLVCCLTFHAMIPRADATALAPAIPAVVSVVTSPAGLIIGATLLALGIAKGVNPEGFESTCRMAQSALEDAGTWIKDGMVELLRTEDADGNASYYVDSGLMEDVRSWMFDSGTVSSVMNTSMTYPSEYYYYSWSEIPFCKVVFTCSERDTYFTGVFTTQPGVIYQGYQYGNKYSSLNIGANSSVGCPYNGYYWSVSYGSGAPSAYTQEYLNLGDFTYAQLSQYNYGNTSWSGAARYIAATCSLSFGSSLDVSLGSLPLDTSDLTDGTSARQWSEDFTDRGLKVYGGGSGNNNNDGKWFWKLMLPTTAVTLLAMSQADQWSGETPKEFDDYTTKEELEIVSRPEVEFGQGVELAPVTSPEPNPDPDPDPGTTPDVNTDYSSWFSKLYTVVQNIQGKLEEIPNKFQSWISDCKTAIEELPSKFAEWFNNIASKLERIIEGITTLGQEIIQGLQTLGQNIVSGIQNAISTLFQPSPDYFSEKVAALKAKHHNIDKFTQLGNDFKLFFTGLGSKPPVIWIDLGAATGSYLWGGKHIFMDLTWYSQYKSKMDFILGAIIWLWLGWRVFLSVPGIINGASGVWGKYHRGGSRDDN